MQKVKVVEIGPRDGFQNVKDYIPIEIKCNIIDGIVNSGVKKIQITSFVSPRAIPQMHDAEELTYQILNKYDETDFFALVPNFMGAKTAVKCGLKEIATVISLSEMHNRNNVKRTKEQSLEELARIRQIFPDLKIIQDIATVFGCPFEGEVKSIEPLLELIEKIRRIGIHSFTLCDTVGMANPFLVEKVFKTVGMEFSEDEFSVHIHDTRNMGIINSYIALINGANSIQTAIGGLGGCPFAPGATGNTSTEDLVYMLNKSGYDTGIDFEKLLTTAKYAFSHIKGNYSGHHIRIPENPCIIIQE